MSMSAAPGPTSPRSAATAWQTEDQWEFIRWRNQMFATNYTDDPQQITLGGALFADLTTDLRIKHWAVVRSFVMAGWTEDAIDGDVPWRVRWCAFNDPTDWTPAPSTLSDYEDLAQKKIQRVFGGEQAIIMHDTAITRAHLRRLAGGVPVR